MFLLALWEEHPPGLTCLAPPSLLPGSRNVRIGLASQTDPIEVPHCVAYRLAPDVPVGSHVNRSTEALLPRDEARQADAWRKVRGLPVSPM